MRKPKKSKTKKEKKQKSKSRSSDSSGNRRRIYPIEECQEVHYHIPEWCRHCGEELSGEDKQPYRHQIIEIPPISAYIIEHQLHQLDCDCCGKKTRASLPNSVPATGYGDRLAATVAWLNGEHRQSHRMIESLISTLLGVEISRGSISRIRQQVSKAIAEPVEQAQQYVKTQTIVNSDETSFTQGNGDGRNAKRTKGWLWLLATKWVKSLRLSSEFRIQNSEFNWERKEACTLREGA